MNLLGLRSLVSFILRSLCESNNFILHPFFDGEIASVLELKIARRLLIIFVDRLSQKSIEDC